MTEPSAAGKRAVVALDGPAGAGKTTIARAVAAALGWTYLDTGALYRAVALAALERGVAVDDGAALARVARALSIGHEEGRTTIDGRDVTSALRSPEVTDIVSTVAAHPEVRAALVEMQRAIAEREAVVIEGRDIGTAVVPDARIKVFLTASLEERARRRVDQEQTGSPGEVERALERRDSADTARDHSPLAVAHDATVIDSTNLSVDEVVARILELM